MNGSFPSHAIGCYCLWSSYSSHSAHCFFGLVPCICNTLWPFNVVSWYDFWLRAGVCYNYGWHTHWNGPPYWIGLQFRDASIGRLIRTLAAMQYGNYHLNTVEIVYNTISLINAVRTIILLLFLQKELGRILKDERPIEKKPLLPLVAVLK